MPIVKRTPSAEYEENRKKKRVEAEKKAAATIRRSRERRAADAIVAGDQARANRILQGTTYDTLNEGGAGGGVQGIGLNAAKMVAARKKNRAGN